MKHPAWLLVPFTFALTGIAGAQDIHKCMTGNVVGYQSAPCAPSQRDAGLLPLPAYADPVQRDGAMSPPSDGAVAAPSDAPTQAPIDASTPPATADVREAFPFRTSIALGMTDDQVLNIPGWGRPSSIVRNGRHQGWRELWTYDRGGETRRLAFVDGRLAGIGQAPLQIASVTRASAAL